MVETTGTVVYLKQPDNATRIHASGIESRIKELQIPLKWFQFTKFSLNGIDYTRILLKDVDVTVAGADYINADHIIVQYFID